MTDRNLDEDGQFCIDIRWTVEDVKVLRPDLNNHQCEAFLHRNRRCIEDRMIEDGWDILSINLQLDDELPPVNTTALQQTIETADEDHR